MGEELGNQRFRIVEFSVDEHSGSNAYFVRDNRKHESELWNFFEKTGRNFSRFNYLGEWHTHPSFSVHPSVQDVCSMQDLLERSKEIDFAVLFIARLKWNLRFDCSASVFFKSHQFEDVDVIFER